MVSLYEGICATGEWGWVWCGGDAVFDTAEEARWGIDDQDGDGSGFAWGDETGVGSGHSEGGVEREDFISPHSTGGGAEDGKGDGSALFIDK